MIVAYPGVQALDVTGPHEVFAGAGDACVGAARRRPTPSTSSRWQPGPVRHRERAADRRRPARRRRRRRHAGRRRRLGRPRRRATTPSWSPPSHDWPAGPPGRQRLQRRVPARRRRPARRPAGDDALGPRRRPRRRAPGVDVDADPIWTRDGNVWTSAGVTAGIDVALALVEDDHGVEVAETSPAGSSCSCAGPATRASSPPRCGDGGPRRAGAPGPGADRGRPAADHRLPRPRPQVALSERHLLRRFTAEVGVTPARYVAAARVEAARRELESSDDTVAAIAARVGFGTAESMRRTFVRDLGTPPDDYRRRFTHRPEGPRLMTTTHDRHPPVRRFTALDGIGPVRGAAADPRLRRHVRRPPSEVVRSDNGFLGIQVDATYEEVPRARHRRVPRRRRHPRARPRRGGARLGAHAPTDARRSRRRCAPGRWCSPRPACSTG